MTPSSLHLSLERVKTQIAGLTGHPINSIKLFLLILESSGESIFTTDGHGADNLGPTTPIGETTQHHELDKHSVTPQITTNSYVPNWTTSRGTSLPPAISSSSSSSSSSTSTSTTMDSTTQRERTTTFGMNSNTGTYSSTVPLSESTTYTHPNGHSEDANPFVTEPEVPVHEEDGPDDSNQDEDEPEITPAYRPKPHTPKPTPPPPQLPPMPPPYQPTMRPKHKGGRINSEAEERTAMIIGIVAGALIAVILVILLVLWIKSGDRSYKMEHDKSGYGGQGPNAALLGSNSNYLHHGSMQQHHHHGGSMSHGHGGGVGGVNGASALSYNGSMNRHAQDNKAINGSSNNNGGHINNNSNNMSKKRDSKDVKEWYV